MIIITIDDESMVVIREGLTSESNLLQTYEWPLDRSSDSSSFRSFVTTLSTGFYISFRGVFNMESRFAIVYTSFSYVGKEQFIIIQRSLTLETQM